jgi:hypothetical protein
MSQMHSKRRTKPSFQSTSAVEDSKIAVVEDAEEMGADSPVHSPSKKHARFKFMGLEPSPELVAIAMGREPKEAPPCT